MHLSLTVVIACLMCPPVPTPAPAEDIWAQDQVHPLSIPPQRTATLLTRDTLDSRLLVQGGGGFGHVLPAHEVWTMYWDDSVDGKVVGRDKSCQVDLRISNGSLAGEFTGDPAWVQRDAAFTGEVVSNNGFTVVSMRQDELGYCCLYCAYAASATTVSGIWIDTRGGKGDFTMTAGR